MSEYGESYSTDAQWWLEEEGDAHDCVIRTVQYIRTNQTSRKFADILHASMYGAMPAGGGTGQSLERLVMQSSTRLSLNVCRNMVGAVVSKIASKNKPKPTFLTEAGNYEMREKAQNLEKFVGGVFYESGVYKTLPKSFRDMAVFGTGILKIYPGTNRVEVDRVLQRELVVDDEEGRYGEPQNMYQRKYIDRCVVRQRWAPESDTSKEAMAIRAALMVRQSPDPDDVEFGYQTTADTVLVTEAWHLGEDEDTPGRHVIAMTGCTLLDEEWEGPFPFAFMRWTEPLEGFFGVGLVDELMGVQREINKLLGQIQRGHHLIVGHYLIDSSSKVLTAMINNDLTALVKYSGNKPEYQTPQIISPEVYNHLWQLYAKAFEITGISQLSATGQKPSGLDAAVALETYNDIQTERFLEVGQAYEEFVIEAARQVVRCAKRIGGGYRVRSVDKNSIDFINWSDVDVQDDLFVIRVYPTSMIPNTPAGKQQWAQNMIKSGMMPSEDVLETVDFPDTQAFAKRALAARKVIERNVAHILKTGEYVTPEPFDDHKLALKLVNQNYHEARLDGVPPEKLELIMRYLTDTSDYLGIPVPTRNPAQMGTPPPGAMPPPAPPGAPPMAPPGPPMPPPMGAQMAA